MECQPRLNEKCKPVIHCISSFEKLLLWKVIRYNWQLFFVSHQFFYRQISFFNNFLELHSTLSEKGFHPKFSFLTNLPKPSRFYWPKSVNCGKSFWSAFPEMLSEIFFSEGISGSNCRFSDLLFGTNFKNSYFDKNIRNYLQTEFLELLLCWFHRYNLYNFFFERFIWKMISAFFLWFDCWTLKEWKTAKAQNHSVSAF